MTEAAIAISPGPPPAREQGQLVRLRNRFFLVRDVFLHEADRGEVSTRLDLECLDDDRLGEGLSVLWEQREVLQADQFPPLSGKWNHPRRLQRIPDGNPLVVVLAAPRACPPVGLP